MTDNKTVLITGATRGIGLAFAELYKANGWNVIAAARSLETADKLKAVAPYKLVQLDASDEDSIVKAAKELEGETIDLLINNAGIAKNDSVATATKASMLQQFEVNAVGPFLVTRAFLPHLRAAVAKSGSATVGQLSSVMGSIEANLTGDSIEGSFSGNLYGYRASKTALNMISANLALDLKKDKVVIVALHPGHVTTDMTGHTGKQSAAGLSKVLAGVTEADTGKFFRYDGKNLPW